MQKTWSPEFLWQKIESLTAIPTLKHKYPHWMVFARLFDFVMDDSQMSVSCPHLLSDFPSVPWTFSSGCYPFALIHHAWKQIHNSCPPPLIYTSPILTSFFSALLFLLFCFKGSRFSHIKSVFYVLVICCCCLLVSVPLAFLIHPNDNYPILIMITLFL